MTTTWRTIRMLRRMFLSLFSFVFCCSCLFARTATADIGVAMEGVVDAVLAVSASQIGGVKLSLQGVGIYNNDPDDGSLMAGFTRSDLSGYSASLVFNSQDEQSWYQSLLGISSSSISPLREKVVKSLEKVRFQPGDVVVDGTVLFSVLGEGYHQNELGKVYSFSVDVSLVVSGDRLSSMVLVEGRIYINVVENGTVVFMFEGITVNGERMDFPVFEL